MMGSLRDWTGGYSGGLLVLATVLVIEALLVAALRLPSEKTRDVAGIPLPAATRWRRP
jgi:hypothetical protein